MIKFLTLRNLFIRKRMVATIKSLYLDSSDTFRYILKLIQQFVLSNVNIYVKNYILCMKNFRCLMLEIPFFP